MPSTFYSTANSNLPLVKGPFSVTGSEMVILAELNGGTITVEAMIDDTEGSETWVAINGVTIVEGANWIKVGGLTRVRLNVTGNARFRVPLY